MFEITQNMITNTFENVATPFFMPVEILLVWK